MIEVKTVSGIVRVAVSGDIDGPDVEQMLHEIPPYCDKLREQSKPVLLMIDVSGIRSETSSARREAIKFLHLRYDKMAVFGAKDEIARVIEYLIKTAGILGRSRYFKTRQEAEGWLLDKNPKLKRPRFGAALGVVASILLLAGIIFSWQATKESVVVKLDKAKETYSTDLTNKLNSRFQTYLDLGQGFAAFFESSDRVTGKDYSSYFEGTRISERYPGFRAITMIRYVPASGITRFEQAANTDPFFKQKGVVYKVENSKRGYYLPLLFVEPQSSITRPYGVDLAVSDARRENLLTAMRTGMPSYSEPYDLNNLTKPNDPEPGFIISTPIYRGSSTTLEQRERNIYGFINTAFAFDELYTNLLKDELIRQKVGFVIQVNNQPVYSNGVQLADGQTLSYPLAATSNKTVVQITYPKNFGLAKGEDGGPLFILIIGLIIWLLLNSLLLMNARKRSAAIKLASKMTKDLSTEKALSDSQKQRIQAVLTSIGDGVFAINKDREVILFNPAAQEISGFSAEEVLGKPYDEVLIFQHEDSGKKNDSFIVKALSGENAKMSNHTVLITRAGFHLAVADSASPIRENGEIIGAIVVFRDAREERELDRRAQIISEAKAKDDALLAALGEGLLVFDTEGKVTRANKAAQQMLGYTENELLDRPFSEAIEAVRFDGEKIEPKDRPAVQAYKTSKTINESFNYITKSGAELPVRVSVAPVLLGGKHAGSIELFQDITKERELDKSKDDFIGLVSHQLSTPATAVKANLGMIREGFVTTEDEIRKAVEEAYASNERQIHIVQDLLNVARIENKRLVIDRQKITLVKEVEKVVDDLKFDLADRNHTVEVHIDSSIELSTDPKLLDFIINNLISNASKYSKQTDPLIVTADTTSNEVSINVIDHGVGISKADQAKLFKRFSRVDNPLSTVVGGTGLGLFIAQQMAELLGGTIQISSEIGKGSIFTIKLPIGEKHGKNTSS